MEKASERQRDFIVILAERYQVNCPDLRDFTYDDADMWIRKVLRSNGNKHVSQEVKIKPVQWGLALKLVYQRWVHLNRAPLSEQIEFRDEVKKTYLLFELE